jgi:hypothetical protein
MADVLLPELFDGEIVVVSSVSVVQKKTKPPLPYTEGTLLDDMQGAAKFIEDDAALKRSLKETSGLGTAATRDSVIEGLKHDKYLVTNGKNLDATPKGVLVIEWLESVLPEMADVAMTARWEAELGIVAKEGGGPAFEAKMTERVIKMVATLKAAPAFKGTNSSLYKEPYPMSENDQPRVNKPTDKMLEFAKNIAKKIGQPVPDDVMSSFDACKAFLDSNKDAANRPSEKQLTFANSISLRTGVAIPAAALANGKELSVWIDENLK